MPAPFVLRRSARFAVGTLAASLSTAFAQSTADTASTQLDTIIVTGHRDQGYTVPESSAATKLGLSLRETPQSITVITRQRMEDQNLTSLRQVLDNAPGIYSNAYDTERVLFYSRGFLVDTLLYDGVPATTNFNTGSLNETLDTALYDRIEIVRGATGLMTGAGNPAASVNLVRKHADSRTPKFTLDASAGSWDFGRLVLDGTVPLTSDGRVRARLVGAFDTTRSYQNLYQREKHVFSAIVDADITPATRVSLGFDYQSNQPRGNTWGSFPLFLSDGSAANWPRSVTTATDWSFWNRRTQTWFGEFRHSFDNGWQVRSTLSHRRYDENLALFYTSGFPDPVDGTGLSPFAYKSRGKINENALDLYATGPFSLFGRKHEAVVGYNGSRGKNTGTEYASVGTLADTGNFFEWNGSYPQPQFTGGTPLNDIKTNQDAIYAALRISIADPLKVIAGARYMRWKIDSFYVYDTPTDSSYDYKKTIPYAGLVWDFAPQFSAFASYTGIFKPQNARDIGGSYLDPIKGRSYEVGIKGEHFDRMLNTAITVFQTRQDNIAGPVFDPDTGEAVLLPDGTQASRAIDGTRTKGFEIEAQGRFSDEVQGSIGWTRYMTRDGTNTTIRTFIPSTLVRGFVTWEPKRLVPNLTLGAGVNYQSSSNTFVGSPGGGTTFVQGSVTQASLMARYRFSKNAALQLNATNLFDRKYYVLDQYDNTYYGSPANYSATLRLSY